MKKRIVSMLLALTLVVSGTPVGITAEGVYAAEISESEVVAETEETQDAVEDKDVYNEELHSEAGDLYAFNVSADGKAVGSDGVVYDDVAYLSADTVKSFGAEGQSTYVEICDRIAEEKNAGDYFENAVIAVDEEGNLFVQRKVSMKLLQTLMRELTEEAFEDEVEDDAKQAAEKTEELSAQETEELSAQENEKGIDTDDSLDEEDLHNEDSDEENGNDEIDAEEVEEASKVEATVEEDLVEKEEPTTEDVITEDIKTDDALVEDVSEEELSMQEDLTDSAMADSVTTEDMEVATEESALSAENMELIDKPEVEEFEVVENAKADLIVDLGYGKTGDMQQFNSLLPTGDYFYNQLNNDQKKIYNASKVLGKGTNKITLKQLYEYEDIYRAMSAYIISEPYKCEWIDTTRFVDITDTILVVKDATTGAVLSRKFDHTTITFSKSEYYTPEIQKEANAKVLEIASEAQAYAIKNYPYIPVYGIVKYFDNWICEHNYYNNSDGTDKESGTPILVKDNNGELRLVGYDLGKRAEPYYYCHSSYGALLKNYGVCESYALAMTRLLDAVGIPNIYATGDSLDKNGNPAGGHAWNYIEMPDGKWYLQDSTWNEVDIDTPNKVDSASTEAFLLCADDTNQPYGRIPNGNRWLLGETFTFEPRSSSYYQPPMDGEIILSKRIINLLPKQKETLTCKNAYTDDENVSKVWLSSNEKVAKVDQNGNVTAVAPGIAEITYVVAGISDTCIVTVSQIDALTFNDSGKASLTTSGSIVAGNGEEQHILLTVNQKVPIFSAEDLVIEASDHEGEDAEILNAAEILDAVKIDSDISVATVTPTLTEDTIDLKITPLKVGKTKIVVTFGAKKATLNYSVGEKLDENWFNLDEVKKLEDESKAGTLMYTGKAYKPKVVLSDDGKAKKVKFKVSYLNNKDAGTASVIITGTGTYGGEIRRTFNIKALPLNVDPGSLKIAASSLYNGGVNQAKSTVKNLDGTKKVGLKAGKDYDIMYKKGEDQSTAYPEEVGIYTMQIVGKGNYTGTYSVPNTTTYEIKKNDIKKVKVAVKVNGTVPVVTVAIGKNGLPRSDYKLTYYTDKNCEDQIPGSVFMKKTQYFVKIEGVGSNLTNEKPIVKSFKTK